MALIAWMVAGLISGWLISELAHANETGFLYDVLFGIIGALAGGMIATYLLGVQSIGAINLVTLLTAFAGAMIIIAVSRIIRGGRHTA